MKKNITASGVNSVHINVKHELYNLQMTFKNCSVPRLYAVVEPVAEKSGRGEYSSVLSSD